MCRLLVEVGGYPLTWAGISEGQTSPQIRRVAQAGPALALLELLPPAWSSAGIGRDPTDNAIRAGQPAFCSDMQSELPDAPYVEMAGSLGLSSCAALPLSLQGQVYGVLTLYASGPDAFSPEKRDFFQTLSAFICQGLTSFHLEEALARAAGGLAQIFERRRLQEALREAEDRYGTIFNNEQVGLFRWRFSDGRMLEANEGMARMLGYEAKEDFLREFEARRHFIDPDAGDRLLESLEDGQLRNFVARFSRRDGSVVWLRLSGRLDSERGFLEGVATDLTELRNAQDLLESTGERHRILVEQLLGRTLLGAAEQQQLTEAIQGERDFYEKILNQGEDGLAAFDRDFTITLWNPSMKRLTGLSQTKALGNNIFRVLPFLEEADQKSSFTGVGGYPRFFDLDQPQKLSPAGPEGFYSGQLMPLLDDRSEVSGGVLLIRDCTPLRRAETALKEQQNLLEGVLGSVEDGLAILDRELTFIRVNPAFKRWFAQDVPLVGKKCHAVIHETPEPCEKCPALQALVGGEPVQAKVYQRGVREGHSAGGELWFYPLKDSSTGETLGIILRMVDITAKPKVEAGQEESRETFVYQQAEERGSRFEAQLRQETCLDAIGSLAGAIAHDFNNILGVMLGYTEMALMSVEEDDVSKRRLQQVLRAGKRGKELVNQILALSRPPHPERQPVRLSDLVRQVLPTIRATLPSSLDINLRLAEDRDDILVDPAQMHQMIISLCANAIQARRDQKGFLDISVTPVNLDAEAVARLSGLSPGPHVRLIVKNTGVGLDQDALGKISDPFVSPEKTEGSGLSLAVLQDIIKAHQGVLTVKSGAGRGTEFHLYLPKVVAGQLSGGAETAARENGRQSLLLVDDEEWLADIWKEILESLGYRTTVSTSPLRALEMVKETPREFDLVIADQTMPQMTGLELAEELGRLRPELPIILVTSFSESVNQDRAEKVGIREYIMKPLSISELTNAVRRVLETQPQG